MPPVWSLLGGVKWLVFGWLISSLYFMLPKYKRSFQNRIIPLLYLSAVQFVCCTTGYCCLKSCSHFALQQLTLAFTFSDYLQLVKSDRTFSTEECCEMKVVVLSEYKCRSMQSGAHLRTEEKKRLLPRRGCYWSHGVYYPDDPPPNSRCSPPSPSHYPQSPAGCLLPHLLKINMDMTVCQCFGART